MTKKILAIILAAVMLVCFASCAGKDSDGKGSTPAGSTTPEASTPQSTPEQSEPEPDRDPVVYDFVKKFEDLSETPFSFGVKRATGGLLPDATTTWYDGSVADVTNLASGQALTGYRTKAPGGEFADVSLMGGEIVWYPTWSGSGISNVIVFTAPEDGTYDYDFVGHSKWGCTHSSTAYKVEVGGSVHNNNSVSYPKGTGAGENGKLTDTLTNFKGTVELKAGETIFFIYDPESDASSDNSVIKKLKVTLN